MDRAASRFTTHAKSFTTQNCFWDAACRARHVATSTRAASPFDRALCGRSHDGTDDKPHAPNRAAALSARSLSSPVSSFARTDTTDSSSGNVCTDRLCVWLKCLAKY